MKKYISIFVLLLLIIPSIVFASWYNPLSWFHNWTFKKEAISKEELRPVENNINGENLTARDDLSEIDRLKREVILLKQNNTHNDYSLDNSNNNSDKVNITTPSSQQLDQKQESDNNIKKISRPLLNDNGTLNISEYYNMFYVSDYLKNNKNYKDKSVNIMNGVIVSFNQGHNSYIEIKDWVNKSSGSIELLVENDNDYTNLLDDKLKIGDRVVVYGFGGDSVKFRAADNGKFDIIDKNESYDSYEPVVKVDAIYRCSGTSPSCQQAANGTKVFLKKQ